jgi:GNAT superfamily N-acetyltransferase
VRTAEEDGPLTVEVLSPDELTADQRRSIRRSLRDTWPEMDIVDFERRHDGYYVIASVGARVSSFLAMVERTIDVGGSPVEVCGIGGVVTVPEARGRGYGSIVLERAREHMERSTGADFGFLRCAEGISHFYGRLGWQRLLAKVRYEESSRVPPSDLAMVLPIRGIDWPPGDIDLLGPPW